MEEIVKYLKNNSGPVDGLSRFDKQSVIDVLSNPNTPYSDILKLVPITNEGLSRIIKIREISDVGILLAKEEMSPQERMDLFFFLAEDREILAQYSSGEISIDQDSVADIWRKLDLPVILSQDLEDTIEYIGRDLALTIRLCPKSRKWETLGSGFDEDRSKKAYSSRFDSIVSMYSKSVGFSSKILKVAMIASILGGAAYADDSSQGNPGASSTADTISQFADHLDNELGKIKGIDCAIKTKVENLDNGTQVIDLNIGNFTISVKQSAFSGNGTMLGQANISVYESSGDHNCPLEIDDIRNAAKVVTNIVRR